MSLKTASFRIEIWDFHCDRRSRSLYPKWLVSLPLDTRTTRTRVRQEQDRSRFCTASTGRVHRTKSGAARLADHHFLARSSHLRPKGTLETVAIKSVTNVEHERMLVDNVVPAIKANFPVSRKNQPVYIQLDNARPHTVRVDKLIEEQCAVGVDGWDIRIKRQPPNSPDLNVLDLVSENSRSRL